MNPPNRPFFRSFMLRRSLVIVVFGLFILIAAVLINLVRGEEQGISHILQGNSASEVLYLAPSSKPELWITGLADPEPVQLTSTGGSVYDYAVSPDGARITFSAQNAQGGYDLFEIEHLGTGSFAAARLILPCATDLCISPAYEPAGNRIAYSRRKLSGLAGAQPGAPRIWIYNRDTEQTNQLYADPNIGGLSAGWSADGRYLAFVDDLTQAVRVIDMQTRSEYSIPAGEGADFAFSPDNRRLLVVRTASAHEHPYTLLVAFDLQSGQESIWMDDPEIDTSVPVWSPGGETLAVARRLIHDGPGKQIWLLNSDGSPLQAVTENPQANHAAYHWSASGEQLLFQRLAFGSSSSAPEVLVWDRRDGSLRVLAEDAFQPGWIH